MARMDEHKDIKFVSPDGRKIILSWQKNEYRAFQETASGRLMDLFLGSTSAENLKEYIMGRR